MANNTSTFTLRLRTQGMDQAQQQSQAIANNMQAAQQAANNMGGSSTSRRFASSAAASPTGAAGASAGVFAGQEVRDYSRARGAAGASGGSARDFADQARGLGGLVRLYATYAANLFAVTAAFEALSRAMDTSNMIKGLDQLGAASGTALGSLSRELVKATGGAISLREAMEATTKATSAGLSSQQVIQLGEAATKASQAMGLNLTDAVSRLSRGISKLEPELLDELGIFVKIEDAVEKYARSVNKTSSSLTEYERKQAFAIEALGQANKKFGEIELDTNPYTKLSASLKDLAQFAGEFINQFVGPVVKYLSESPVALALAVGFVAKTIVNQAVPAFGQYRDSLKRATIETASKAKELIKIQNDLAESRDEAAASGAVTALKESQAIKTRLDQLKQNAQSFTKTRRTDYTTIADVDPFAINEGDFTKLEKRLEKRAKTLSRSNSTEASAIRAHIAEIKAIRQEADDAAATAQALVEQRDSKFYTQQTVTRLKAERALKQTNRASILEQVNTTQSLEGARAAWKKLNEELAKPKREVSLGIDPESGEELTAIVERTKGFFGFLERGSTRLRGGFGIAFQAISDFASAWGPLISGVIGAGLAAFETLDSWLSTNKKQLQEFSENVENAERAVKLVGDTLERISKQELGSALLPQNIEARANAFTELSISIEKSVKSFQDLNAASSTWDNIKDFFKGLVGESRLDDLGESLTKQITSALDAVNLEEREGLRDKLKSILDVADLDTSQVVAALKKAGDEGGAVLAEKISKSVKAASEKAAVDSAKLKEALSVFDNLNKSYQDLSNSLRDSSTLGNFANQLIQGSIEAEKALSNTVNTVSYFRELLKDPKKLRLFDENSIKLAKDYEQQIDSAAKTIQSIETELKAAEKAFENTFGESYVNEIGVLVTPTIDEAEQNKLREKIQEGLKAKAKLDLDVESIKGKLGTLLEQPLIKGMQIATQEFQKSMQKVQLDILGSLVSRLSGVGKAEAEFQIQKERIEIEKSSISAMYELVRSIEKNSITIKQVDTERALRERGTQLGTAGGMQIKDTEYLRLEATLKQLTAGAEILDKGLRLTSADFEALRKKFPNIAKELISFFQSTMGTRAKLGQQEGQLKIGEIARDLGVSSEKFTERQTRSKEELELLNITKDRQALLSNIYGIENTSLILAKQAATTLAELKTQEIARAEISQKKAEAEQVQSKLNQQIAQQGGKVTEAQQAALNLAKNTVIEQNKQLEQFDKQTEAKNRFLKVQNDIEKISSQTAAEQKRLEFDKQRLDTQNELQQVSLNASKQEFDSLVARGLLSEEYAANRTAQLATEAQQLQYNRQISDAAAQKRLQDLQAEDQFKKAMALAGGDFTAEIKAYAERNAQEEKNKQLYQDRIKVINATNDSTNRGIELTRLQSVETAKQNEELKKQAELLGIFTGIADALSQAFGKTGEALGKLVSTIGEVIDGQETYNRERLKQSKIIDEVASKADSGYLSPDDMARMNQAVKTRGDLDRKNARDELTNNAKLVGAAKNLFKEKSTGYKILSGIEKAMHVYKMATWAKEQAADLIRTASSSSNALVRGLADGAAAVAKTLSSIPFPANVAAAAAVAAIVKSLFGGGPDVQPVGFAAEEQQKVQGSGQVLRDGKLVTTGAGVLGDPTAKSKSVENAIANMERYDFKNLEYSNQMLDALRGIRKNTENFAGNLLRSIPGLNIKPETLKSGNWLFGKDTTEVLDQGIKIIGTVGQIIDQSAQIFKYQNTKTSSSGFLGLFSSTSYNPTQDRVTNSALQRDLSLIFKDVGTALGGAAEQLGMGTAESVMQAFRSVDLSEEFKRISLMDLKPDEMVEALMSVVSSGMDMAAMQLMPSLDKFRKAGESFADTVLRVANDTRVVGLSFEELGMTLPKLVEQGAKPTQEQLNRLTTAQSAYNSALAATKVVTNQVVGYDEGGEVYGPVTGSEAATAALASALIELTSAQSAVTVASNSLTTRNIELVQSYIDAAGGLDEFVEKNRFFADNFLTEAERLAPVQERVNKEVARLTPQLANLGITSLTTRDQFKNAVFAAKDLGAAGVQLYSDLMDLATAFVEVTKAAGDTTKTLTTEEFRTKTLSQQQTILKLMGLSEEALALQRQEELAELAKYPPAMSAVLIANQKRIYQLEDEAKNQEFRLKVLGQLQTGLKLLGDSEEALRIQRDLEIETLKKYPKAQADVLVANQLYIYALEDEKALKDKLIQQRDKERSALNATISSLKTSITTLKDYKTALLGGDKSIFTPLEKYQQNQLEFLRLQSIAMGPATTEAERTAQADAISKLPAAADKFLESSRTMFASSDAYTADFNKVTGVIDQVNDKLVGQKATPEKQLDELEKSTAFLDSIDSNTKTTAELLQEYLASQRTSATLAGGINVDTNNLPKYGTYGAAVQGTSFGVAQQASAEGVSPSTQTATTADATTTSTITDVKIKEPVTLIQPVNTVDAGMATELAKANAKLQEVVLQLETLRAEQKAQTGSIITSNAQVVNDNAQTVSTAITTSNSNNEWYGRQLVGIPA